MKFKIVWERIQKETDIENISQLSRIVGKTQPTVSAKKNQGKEFPIEWAYLVGERYNLVTKWILTGEGPKKSLEINENHTKKTLSYQDAVENDKEIDLLLKKLKRWLIQL
ncbi:MAG: hypothetical protein D3923_15810, partial [Candidatus Electrothrix sp. AR3]|nr:hypothetical protein [Candidatus Electrothrix sp. AR3]